MSAAPASRSLRPSGWNWLRCYTDELVIAAYHRKHNAGRLASPFGLRLQFQPDGAVRVTGTDLADSPDLLARTSLSKRITVTLAGGAMTIPALAEHLSASEETVRRTVHHLRDKRHVVQVGDTRPAQWGLPTP